MSKIRICITLDDVIRAKSEQFGKMYKKYIDQSLDLDTIEFNTNDYCKLFNFNSKNEYNKHLYEDYAYEIFGEAPVIEKSLDKKINLWLLELQEEYEDDERPEVLYGNPFEFGSSIGCTNFFLAKIAPKVREFYFPLVSTDLYNKCDVLITAEPKLLENKPEGKVAVKIETGYNKECPSDFTYTSLSSLLDDTDFIKNVEEKCNKE